jgi:hypothetical protein
MFGALRRAEAPRPQSPQREIIKKKFVDTMISEFYVISTKV